MSAPETNINTQKRRHRGPLVGMVVVVLFVVTLIIYWPSDDTTVEVPQGVDPQAGQELRPTDDTGSGDVRILDPAGAEVAPGLPAQTGGVQTAPETR